MLVIYIIQLMCSMFPCSPTTKSVYLTTDEMQNFVSSSQEVQSQTIFVPLARSGRDSIFAAPDKPSDPILPPTSLYTFPPPKKRMSGNEPDVSEDKVEFQNDEYPIVSTFAGKVKGFTMRSLTGRKFSAFQGIPFAEPPVGELRFRAPVKKSSWTGVKDAIAESPTCLQADFFQLYKLSGQEDCLHLNVYTHKVPVQNQKLSQPLQPVMVFIHGGGFFFGSSNLYGPAYIMEEDAVFVSMNYRLGSLGFLSTGDEEAPGNNGLKDQALALKWVKDNIHAFGGDPNRVTLFGESAGAGSVSFHMVSPLSRGLFHRGISQSGCSTCFWSISERAVELGKRYASSLNCSTETSKGMMQCLRNLDGASVVLGQLSFLEWTMYPVVIFGPVIEPKHKGAFLNDLPENIYQRGEAANVPWISGFNSDEGALNIATLLANPSANNEVNSDWDKIGPVFLEMNNPRDANMTRLVRNVREYYMGERNVTFNSRHDAVKMFGDRYVMVCGVKAIQYHAKYSGAPVYAYHFNYRGNYSLVQKLGQRPSDWGVSHLDDLIYLMNNTMYYPTLKATDEDYRVSRLIIDIWTNFAKHGEPSLTSEDGVTQTRIWKPVESGAEELEYLQINLTPKMIPDPFCSRVKFWKKLRLEE